MRRLQSNQPGTVGVTDTGLRQPAARSPLPATGAKTCQPSRSGRTERKPSPPNDTRAGMFRDTTTVGPAGLEPATKGL